MAQLKDLIVTGASQLVGDVNTSQIQISKIKALSEAGGSTYSTGTTGQVLMSNGDNGAYWGTPAASVTESTVSGWGFTKNTGTITGVTADKGLEVSGTTIGHSNSVTAQSTQAIYPIKIDAQGHITAYGAAVTPLTASSTLDATKLTGTIPANCYTNTTYSSLTAASGGTDVSLVTTGEKYTWNNNVADVTLNTSTRKLQKTINGTTSDIMEVSISPGEGSRSAIGGSISTASGSNSFAFGNQANATGNYSFAFGRGSQANGEGSVAVGKQTIATADYSFVCGICNIEDTNGDYAFIIGNGTNNSNRSNLFTIGQNGNIVTTGSLTLNGTTTITATDISNWNNSSVVSISPTLTSGTKIGTITIDGTSTDLYSRDNDLIFQNKTVAISSWVSDSSQSWSDEYGYKGTVAGCTGVTSAYIPTVVFDYDDLSSGNFAPYATCDDNGNVYIYAKAAQTSVITIPTIHCVTTDNTGGTGSAGGGGASGGSSGGSGSGLPAVTSADDGKILMVQNGVWTAVSLATWTGGSY